MSNPFFSSPERKAALLAAAKEWEGTPFAPASAIKGERGGVCCHRLVIGVLIDAGFPITQDECPGGTMNRATHHEGSVMADWIRLHPGRFADMPEGTPRQAGDILTIRLGIGSNHLAIMADDEQIIHSWQGVGAHMSRVVEPKFLKRITNHFRPLES